MRAHHQEAVKRDPAGEKRPVRVGVIGAGFGGAVHVPALQAVEGVEVVAICARRLERAHVVAAQYGIKLATADFRDLVRNPSIDALVIATPPHLHHSMTFAALEAGKHVLVEKPLSRSLAEARDLVKMAENRNVIAMVNHEFRFVPNRAYAHHLIEQGYIGVPQVASITVYRSTLNDPHGVSWDWLMEEAKGGGMLGAAGSHYLDNLRWWFGDVKAVAGATATMVKSRRLPDSTHMGQVDADDNFAILLRFANEALATVTYSSTATYEAGEQIVLSGSEGMLMLTGDGRIYAVRLAGGLTEMEIPEQFQLPVIPASNHPLAAPTARLVATWIEAVRTGVAASPSLEDGLKIQELLDGAARSAQLGRWVEVGRSRFQLA